MPRGGKRKGAGAPKDNQNAFKHGGRAKVLYGVDLNKQLTSFEYKALCMEQMGQLKHLDELDDGGTSQLYLEHKERYKGAIFFREKRSKTKSIFINDTLNLIRYVDGIMKIYRTIDWGVPYC